MLRLESLQDGRKGSWKIMNAEEQNQDEENTENTEESPEENTKNLQILTKAKIFQTKLTT